VPRLDEPVHLVSHARIIPIENLDIEILIAEDYLDVKRDEAAMSHTWDPDRYLLHADERGRPFVDLLARVGAAAPARVVDLGCGPGTLTALLAERWPGATVVGVDSSPEMLERARGVAGVTVEAGDVRTWAPAEPVDVLVANATYQWVPGHLELLPRLVGHLAPGGWCAFQVPGNHDEPSHRLLRELAADPRFSRWTEGVARPHSHDPQVYADVLLDLGLRVDAWETTYLHLLTGDDPVFGWISGTGARPVLQALPDDLREVFVAEYKELLRAAYPPGPHGTFLPFRRVFVVAHADPSLVQQETRRVDAEVTAR
jgi:trans-aconitate 2-methyltransferase